jgi:hypothetical protein
MEKAGTKIQADTTMRQALFMVSRRTKGCPYKKLEHHIYRITKGVHSSTCPKPKIVLNRFVRFGDLEQHLGSPTPG